MKWTHKLAIIALALVAVVAVGCVWMVRTIFGIVTDEVDASAPQKNRVQIVRNEAGGESRKAGPPDSTDRVKAADNGTHPAEPRLGAPALHEARNGTPASAGTAQRGADTRDVPTSATGKDRTESLGDMSGILSFFLNDGESDALSPEALLNPSNKSADTDAPDGLDGALRMIPGSDSPTLKAWDEGKYKGRETQIIDDAIEDPKIWRLVFSLGGM